MPVLPSVTARIFRNVSDFFPKNGIPWTFGVLWSTCMSHMSITTLVLTMRTMPGNGTPWKIRSVRRECCFCRVSSVHFLELAYTKTALYRLMAFGFPDGQTDRRTDSLAISATETAVNCGIIIVSTLDQAVDTALVEPVYNTCCSAHIIGEKLCKCVTVD